MKDVFSKEAQYLRPEPSQMKIASLFERLGRNYHKNEYFTQNFTILTLFKYFTTTNSTKNFLYLIYLLLLFISNLPLNQQFHLVLSSGEKRAKNLNSYRSVLGFPSLQDYKFLYSKILQTKMKRDCLRWYFL